MDSIFTLENNYLKEYVRGCLLSAGIKVSDLKPCPLSAIGFVSQSSSFIGEYQPSGKSLNPWEVNNPKDIYYFGNLTLNIRTGSSLVRADSIIASLKLGATLGAVYFHNNNAVIINNFSIDIQNVLFKSVWLETINPTISQISMGLNFRGYSFDVL
jgi:hypothetical protein